MYFAKYIHFVIFLIIPVIYCQKKLIPKQETLYASSIFRRNQILEGVPQLETLDNISSVSHCLFQCMNKKIDCKSLNYGNGECVLMSDSLCANETLVLTPKEGYGYYDIMESPNFEKTHLKDNYCSRYGRCSGKCYPRKPHYIDMALTRAEAKVECEKLFRSLPQPKNLEEMRFFVNFIKNLLIERPEIRDSKDMQFWYGLSDEILEGVWMYDDESSVSDTFSSWAIGQPDNGGPYGSSKEDCGAIGEKAEFKLLDVNCKTKIKFFCA